MSNANLGPPHIRSGSRFQERAPSEARSTAKSNHFVCGETIDAVTHDHIQRTTLEHFGAVRS